MTETDSQENFLNFDFTAIVTILLELATLWAATVVWLQSDVDTRTDMLTQRAKAESALAFGELAQADQEVTHALDIYSSWYEAGEQVERAQGAASAARLSGNTANALNQEASAKRWSALQTDLGNLTPLLSEPFNGQYINFFEETHRPAYLAQQRQKAYAREASDWASKSDNYSNILNLMPIILFLFGMALNIKSRVRYLFVGVGLVLILFTAISGVQTFLLPTQTVPAEAIERFVDGQILSNIAYVASEEEAETLRADALKAFEAAYTLDERYADAYQWHGFTLMQARLKDADPQRNAQAAQDMETAIALGNGGSVIYTNLGWAYTLTGDYNKAVNALEQAIEAESTECTTRFNLGLSLLANKQVEASSRAYDAALDCLQAESPDEKANLLASALKDLGDLQQLSPDTPGVAETLQRFKTISASVALLDEIEPQPLSAKVTDIAFAGGIAADGGAVDLGNTFTPGVPVIYTLIDFNGMPEGTPWLVRWYKDGEFHTQYIASPWGNVPDGLARVELKGSPIPSGNYEVEVFAAGNLLGNAEFEVQPGETVAMQSYNSSYFRLSINHPADWLVNEDHSKNGFLYISDPDDASRYFWYTAFPWEGGENDEILSSLVAQWFSQHPDMQYTQQGQFFLGGLAQADYIPVTYGGADREALSAMLVGTVDNDGNAYMIVMQAPRDAFDATYKTTFDLMLRSLKITAK